MAKKDKTRAQKVQARKRKRNLKTADRYERAAKRKSSRAESKSLTSLGKPKRRAKGVYLAQEAENFASDAKKVKARQGAQKPKSRASMQVTARSSARDLAKRDTKFRKSSGGRKYR